MKAVADLEALEAAERLEEAAAKAQPVIELLRQSGEVEGAELLCWYLSNLIATARWFRMARKGERAGATPA